MGVCFNIVCDTCKTYRDLDKVYLLLAKPTTRKEMLEFSDDVENDSFGAALWISFMNGHDGHVIRIVGDTSNEFDEIRESYKRDKSFWEENTDE